MIRALSPTTQQEAEALRRDYAADMWVAMNGTAMRIPFPRPRNHFEEIANARAEHAARNET